MFRDNHFGSSYSKHKYAHIKTNAGDTIPSKGKQHDKMPNCGEPLQPPHCCGHQRPKSQKPQTDCVGDPLDPLRRVTRVALAETPSPPPVAISDSELINGYRSLEALQNLKSAGSWNYTPPLSLGELELEWTLSTRPVFV